MFYGCYKGVEGLFFLKRGLKGDRKGTDTGESWKEITKNDGNAGSGGYRKF